MASTLTPLDPVYVASVFEDLSKLDIQLDSDPLIYGPKRLNGKIALSRQMSSRCESLFLDASQRLAYYRRALRQAELMLELEMKNLMANDPEVRAGRSVADRNAIATGKLLDEVQAVHEAKYAVDDLEAVISVIKAKRGDLRDVQGRLRDQIRLCQEEIGLGSRWGSKSPRGIELEPGQGFADGNDVAEMDDLIKSALATLEEEHHMEAEVDDSDPEQEQVEALKVAAGDSFSESLRSETTPEVDVAEVLPPSTDSESVEDFLENTSVLEIGRRHRLQRESDENTLDDLLSRLQ